MSILNGWNSRRRSHPRRVGFAAAILLMTGGWAFNSFADDSGLSGSANAIAFHDRDSTQYNDNCLGCHSSVMTESPIVSGDPVANPNLNSLPRTRTAHGTMLRPGNKPGNPGDSRQCQFCHRSVNVVEGPSMPRNPLQGSIRKHVDPALCTLCHGPKVGGQPNSPGPQFYQVGLNALVSDGTQLYNLVCAGCHNPLPNSEVGGESASEIQKKIAENEGGMGPLRVLTPVQVQAIANALQR